MTIWEWIPLYLNLTLIGLVDALSPVRIAIILVLLSGAARPIFRSSVFILGIVSVSIVLSLFLDSTFRLLPTWDDDISPIRIAIGMLLGVGLLIIAIHTWYQHPTTPAEFSEPQPATVKLPNFVQRISDRVLNGNILVVFVGGVAMQLFSIKSLVLLSMALKEISERPLTPTSTTIAISYFIILSTLELTGLVVAFAASPENSANLLNQITNWLLRSTYRVLALVEGMLALYLLLQVFRDLFTLFRS